MTTTNKPSRYDIETQRVACDCGGYPHAPVWSRVRAGQAKAVDPVSLVSARKVRNPKKA